MANDAVTELGGHLARSAEILRVLRREKVAIRKARAIDVFFWCPTQQSAVAVAAGLTEAGFDRVLTSGPTETEGGTRKGQWSAQGQVLISPVAAASESFTRKMMRLASAHGATLDGWGTMHVENER